MPRISTAEAEAEPARHAALPAVAADTAGGGCCVGGHHCRILPFRCRELGSFIRFVRLLASGDALIPLAAASAANCAAGIGHHGISPRLSWLPCRV